MAYRKRKIILFFSLVALVSAALVVSFLSFQPQTEPTIREVKIGGQILKAEIASRPYSQYLGLSGRENLAVNSAMLFLFSDARQRYFVMRGMEFPLDIIFLNNHKILNISFATPPAGDGPEILYASAGPADAVLEVNAGFAKEVNLGVGDYVSY